MSSITSAGQRRRAYQCLKCWNRSDKVFIEARYRVFNHFLKEHVSLDAVPYYCKWCLFRAFKREDLDRHVNGYPRHQAVLREKGVSDSADFLVENRSHYQISERDVVVLSAEESQRHWKAAADKRGDFMAQAMEATYLDLPMSPTVGAETTVPASAAASPLLQTSGHLPPQPATPLPQRSVVYSPPPTVSLPSMPAVPFPPPAMPLALQSPPPLPTAPSASVPVASTEDWRVLTPTLIDVTQIMNPLQQLLSQLVPAQPAATAAPPVPAPATQPPTPPPAATSLPPAPQPEVVEEEEVLGNMPTREECRALGDKSRTTSSTGSSTSSGSSQRMSEVRHRELLSAIGDLKATMLGVRDSFIEASQANQHMAKLVLDLAGICTKRVCGQLPPDASTTTTETQPPPPPANQSFVPVAPPYVPPTTTPRVPLAPMYVPTPVLPPQAARQEPAERHRDRSPLRVRNDRRDSPRRDRSRDLDKENRRRHDSPRHRQDRRVVRSRWH